MNNSVKTNLSLIRKTINFIQDKRNQMKYEKKLEHQRIEVLENLPYLKFGFGYDLRDSSSSNEIIDVKIKEDERVGHFWCFGTTRVGKTRLMENMIESDIKKGFNTIIIDPKLDENLANKVLQTTMDENRISDLMFFDLDNPIISTEFNPLKHYKTVDELVDVVMATIGGNTDSFFKSFAENTIFTVLEAMLIYKKMNNDTEPLNLSSLAYFCRYEGIKKLISALSVLQSKKAIENTEMLKSIISFGLEHFNKLSSNLTTAFASLRRFNLLFYAMENKVIDRYEEISKINYDENSDEEKKGLILLVRVPSLSKPKSSTDAIKILLSTVQRALADKFKAVNKTPLSIYIDEAHSVLYDGIEELFSKAGGANVYMNCFSQSINQLGINITNSAAAKSLLDNVNTKLIMRIPDDRTAQSLSKLFGEKTDYDTSYNSNSVMTTYSKREQCVKYDDLLKLKAREFFLTSQSGDFRGIVNLVSDIRSDISYTRLLDKYVSLNERKKRTSS